MNFANWVDSLKEVPIRYLIYKRFLPEGAHSTDDEFTSCYYEKAYIREAIDTGRGWLLGLESIEEGEDDNGEPCWVPSGIISYYNLNEVRIERFNADVL